jgi:hypothetical protein
MHKMPLTVTFASEGWFQCYAVRLAGASVRPLAVPPTRTRSGIHTAKTLPAGRSLTTRWSGGRWPRFALGGRHSLFVLARLGG